MGTAVSTLIDQTRDKANVLRSNFATNPQIVTYLNEARKQFRELLISADDSYYRASLDFSVGADPANLQALPTDFWKLRGLDAWAGTSRQVEIYAREFRNRHRGDRPGYYFDGGYMVIVPAFQAQVGNPYRIYYTPKLVPLAELTTPASRTITHDGGDNTNAGAGLWSFVNATFSTSDVGGTLTIAGDGPRDGTYEILEAPSSTTLVTAPPPPTTGTMGALTAATIAPATGSRSFAVNAADTVSGGQWSLLNGLFTASDVGATVTAVLNGTAAADNGEYKVAAVAGATSARLVPDAPLAVSNFTGTITVDRQPAATVGELDEFEELFAEYFPVRAAQAIARKKRQDSLVAQLGGERTQIEARISQMGKNRQSEPEQAPVLWRPGVSRHGYCDTDWDI